ncbi:MAG: protein phosphatase 2C domain-containing protein [Defluviitaleaceae bacterium]|nr:protein phosphatase 2C domain-containing protein [Defluviitaleaceae bacterium]
MEGKDFFKKWNSIGSSVIGASHEKRGLENQDSVSTNEHIIAVSDGHGGPRYTRSALGAFFATTIITEVCEDAIIKDAEDLDGIKHLKARFLHLWQKAVEVHLEEYPEIDNEGNEPQIYGCTFLCAIAYPNLVLILTHGDGDILGVYENEVRDLTIQNEKNFGGATLSLASLKDSSEISHKVLVGDEIPSLIVLSTDGVKNSYDDTDKEDLAQFYKIPLAIKKSLEEEGAEKAEEKIKSLLEMITKEGSGDDVTIAVLYNV